MAKADDKTAYARCLADTKFFPALQSEIANNSAQRPIFLRSVSFPDAREFRTAQHRVLSPWPAWTQMSLK
jgi:hypothetical protein